MKSKPKRNSYTKEFKLEALRLAEESEKPASQIAHELGVPVNNLYNWKQRYRNKKDTAFTNQSQLTSEEQEIKRLRLENAQLREERNILKKAAAFFAREPK
jgi:transposase